jgi:hypothetical protein
MNTNLRRAACRAIIPFLAMSMVLILLPGCSPDPVYQDPVPGVVCRWDFESSADGLPIPCTVYLPAGYDPARACPVWLELHSLYGIPILSNDPNNPFSSELKRIADERGWIILAPWGRNLHSLFADGMDRSEPPFNEPEIYDDFSAGVSSWQPAGGSWAVSGGRYVQSDPSPSWKESVHTGSSGENYAVRVKIRDLTPAGVESAVGINLRRGSGGDLYHVDLFRGADGKREVRFFKVEGGQWQALYSMPYEWGPLVPADGWINLKFSCYDDYLEVYVNEDIVNMQPGYDATPYNYGRDVPGTPLPPGKVSLCSYGGMHEFDEVRIQNEYKYGERDVLDCLLGAMEKYRIDPERIYGAGHSQGGLGAFILGLHHPDLFAALRPAGGLSDLHYDYEWLMRYYPRNPGPPYAYVNDGRLSDYIRMLAGGEPGPEYPQRMSVLNGNSARYVLENAVNNAWRIVHGTPDSNVPNSYDPVPIAWWIPWWIFWTQGPAPAAYNPATATYANGKDIADLLESWSSGERYYCEYLTNPFLGHGYMDPYADTAAFFAGRSLNRRPPEVAFKTYDDVNDGAWWLRLAIANPGRNEPGMARVMVNAPANSAAIHARNLYRLHLDLGWMGLDTSAGKTLTFTLDDDTSPNVFPIADNTGSLTLELTGAWTAVSDYTVRLDGAILIPNVDYTMDGTSMVLHGLQVRGGHTLTVTVPASLPANLAPNPGFETGAGGGVPADWTEEVQGGGSATFLWDDLQRHGGARALRVKDASFSSAGTGAVWKSGSFAVTQGKQYLLGVFAKARMLRGASPVIGITWYDAANNPISTAWLKSPGTEDHALNMEWSPMHLVETAPPDSAYASILLGVEGDYAGKTAGSAWFDDIFFTHR